jgi:hypothetical protein
MDEITQYRIGALWGDYEPRFMDFLDSLQLVLGQEAIDDNDKDELLIHLQDVVDNFMVGDITPYVKRRER